MVNGTLPQDVATIDRLKRLEGKVDNLHQALDKMADRVSVLKEAEDRRHSDRLLPERVRVLEEQVAELRIYLRQAKWAVIAAAGALIAGVTNIVLNIAMATMP
ncbi:MAG: hypothetical protein KJ888_20535 [Gammaproteobacteria bacterium]|uniref:Uncharacterized protein n=1 Tax=viral metagenome TaxID=1070528 RepID=A0A6M3IR63_9ZZZZ|nr:hypothetical protein [Gammaproteobacteria bacterium]